MVKNSTPFPFDLLFQFPLSEKEILIPGRFSMAVVMGYAAAFHVMQGSILPQYEMILN